MVSVSRTRKLIIVFALLAQPTLAISLIGLTGSWPLLVEASVKQEESRTYLVAIAAAKEGARTPLNMLAAKDLPELEQWQMVTSGDAKKSMQAYEEQGSWEKSAMMLIYALDLLIIAFASGALLTSPRVSNPATTQFEVGSRTHKPQSNL